MKLFFMIMSVLSLIPRSVFAQSDLTAGSQPHTGTIGIPHNCAGYYPRQLQRECVQGETILGFVITVDGWVRNIEVVQSSGNKLLDDAAEVCASTWHYKPATKWGEPIAVAWRAKVVWVVPPEPSAPDSSEPVPAAKR